LPDIDADLSQYIDGYLTIKYHLDTTTREKPVMNVDDVYLVLHHHWLAVVNKPILILGEDAEHQEARMFIGRIVDGTAVGAICDLR
jgi:hypothetical protein